MPGWSNFTPRVTLPDSMAPKRSPSASSEEEQAASERAAAPARSATKTLDLGMGLVFLRGLLSRGAVVQQVHAVLFRHRLDFPSGSGLTIGRNLFAQRFGQQVNTQKVRDGNEEESGVRETHHGV